MMVEILCRTDELNYAFSHVLEKQQSLPFCPVPLNGRVSTRKRHVTNLAFPCIPIFPPRLEPIIVAVLCPLLPAK